MIASIRYASHLPVLIKVISITDGPVLELGIGMFSTPYLHWACYSKKRELVSYENEQGYIARFKSYENDYHKLIFTDNWDNIKIDRPWDMAFIDHESRPNSRRSIEARRLANFAKYVVLHDTEPSYDKEYKYSEIYPLFKYRYDFKDALPNTSVLSNFVDLTNFKI
jgi:hypothetical protein